MIYSRDTSHWSGTLKLWYMNEFNEYVHKKRQPVALDFQINQISLLEPDVVSDAGRSHSSGTSELIFRPTEGGEVFSQLVSMCADPAILGDKLLHALATMADDAPEPTHSGNSYITGGAKPRC